MAGKLMTLPLRLSLRTAQLMTRAACEVGGRALSITGQAIGAVAPGWTGRASGEGAPPAPEWRQEPAEEAVSAAGVEHPPPGPDAPPPQPAVAPAAEPAAEPGTAPAPPFAEPAHVSEEPVLVLEASEPGAEDGAGADVTVVEPWVGYRDMKAKDVIDRIKTASVAELAAMRLYEARHRARQTVLAAVDRQLKLANVGRPA
jgi:hypothetical protein